MLRKTPFLILMLLILLQACGGVSKDDDDDDGGGGNPPPDIGPFPPLENEVEVENGRLRGVLLEDDEVVLFQGIPYAAPPVGELRWRAPRAALDWSGTREAITPGDACIQGDITDQRPQSEDCLFLNVAAPEGEASSRWPVMIWFHGGGDDNGDSSEVPYDIAGLAAATGHVVVSVNSRLGFLGFMALPGLRFESADSTTGNYHHLDDVAALQWVQDNIIVFNGNPNNVTLFGESAGGNGVCRHLASPLSAGLFHRAIVQSGSCGPNILKPLLERYQQGEYFEELWGCSNDSTPLDCMRQQSAENLRQALFNAGKANNLLHGDLNAQEIFRPIAAQDDYAFDATIYESLSVSPANIDVILGVVRNEYTLFLQGLGNDNPTTLGEYQDAVSTALDLLPAEVSTLTQVLYPRARYESYSDAFADLMGDAIFACPSIATADVLVRGGHSVRFYQFDRRIQNELLLPVVGPLDPNPPNLGVPHSADLFYLWDLRIMQAGLEPELTVAAVQQYWGRFAGNGLPSADDQPDWPLYSEDGAEYLNLAPTITAESGFKLDKCDFFNADVDL